jgi:glycosyltransferase involved in cell wall biosynthesis
MTESKTPPDAPITAEALAELNAQIGALKDELRHTLEITHAARKEALESRQSLERADHELLATRRENSTLRAENATIHVLRRENAIADEQLALLSFELTQIHQSLGWTFIRKTRELRARVTQGRRSAQCWSFCSRLLKTALSLGMTAGASQPPDFKSSRLRFRRHTAHRPGPDPTRSTTGSAGPVNGVAARRETGEREAGGWPRHGNPVRDRITHDGDDALDNNPRHEPTVSVIVPNYNHARYLEERLRSLFEQTYLPHEIIFLDDASTDGSAILAQRLATRSPIPFHLVANDRNSGSPFRQWLRGIALAKGDLIWIAESDDCCRPDFLERVVPLFRDPDVVLGYSQSAMIGPEKVKYADDYHFHTDDVSLTHWRASYCVAGLDEIELALSQKNTIPNASAVVFRKPAHLDFGDELAKMRLTGDWLFYVMQLRTGKIAFLPEVLNFHRRHDQTVRHAFKQRIEVVAEHLYVQARIFETFPISTSAITRSLVRTLLEYGEKTSGAGNHRTTLTSQPETAHLLERIRSVFESRAASAGGLRILMVISDMQSGDSQSAIIRLANALVVDHQVYLCNARPTMLSAKLAASVNDRIVLLEGTLGVPPWTTRWRSYSDVNAFSSSWSPRTLLIQELARFHKVDVIHSHGWWADRLVCAVNRELKIPRLTSLAGGSMNYADNPERDPSFS